MSTGTTSLMVSVSVPSPLSMATPACVTTPASRRYKLLEQIGEGGFGIVFHAEQAAPLRRKVAVKILKPGMDSPQIIARFQAERQALAVKRVGRT